MTTLKKEKKKKKNVVPIVCLTMLYFESIQVTIKWLPLY